MKIEIFNYRFLISELIKQDLKNKYKGSIIGFLWLLLEPLILMLILTFIFTQVLPSGIENFAIYFLIGLIPFRLFSYGTSNALDSIVVNSGLIKKIYFPREIFPLVKVIVVLITFIFDFIILFILFAIFGIPFHMTLLFVPLLILIEFIMILGIGLLISSLYVKWRDLRTIWTILLNLIFWFVPIVYTISFVPDNLQFIYKINPLATLILSFQDVMLYGRLPNLINFVYVLVFSLIIFIVGVYIFKRRNKKFAEEL